jgi:hypothetical protein
VCKESGHLEKYCKKKTVAASATSSTREQRLPPSTNKSGKRGGRPFKKPSNGAARKQAVLAKAFARLAEHVVADDNDYDDYDQEDDEDEYADDDNSEIVANMVRSPLDDVSSCTDPDAASAPAGCNKKHLKAKQSIVAMFTEDERGDFVLDTGCKNAHVLHTHAQSLIRDAKPTSKKVHGVGGSMTTQVSGQLGKFGRALVSSDMDVNLLSVMLIVDALHGSFSGDKQKLEIYDSTGQRVITGINRGDGFWKCTRGDVERLTCLLGETEEDEEEDDVALPEAAAAPTQPDLRSTPPRHFTPEERKRAAEARRLCWVQFHPGSERIQRGLDNGNWPDTPLTSQDVRNADELLGPCRACLEGKMRAAAKVKESPYPPASKVGEVLHCDLIPLKSVSVGGNTFLLFAVCEKSNYVSIVSLKNKSTLSLCTAFDHIIAEYASYSHKVTRIQTDHEANFIACKTHLGMKNVVLTALPAGEHEEIAERNIQTIRARKRSAEAALTYQLPANLEAEAFIAAAAGLNRTPCSRSGLFTPTQLVTGQKPFIPKHYFGEVGLFHKRRQDNTDQRSEWGIFMCHGDTKKSLRAYIPTRQQMYSMLKFVPYPSCPKEWNFKPRIRPPDSAVNRENTDLQLTNSPVIKDQEGGGPSILSHLQPQRNQLVDLPASNQYTSKAATSSAPTHRTSTAPEGERTSTAQEGEVAAVQEGEVAAPAARPREGAQNAPPLVLPPPPPPIILPPSIPPILAPVAPPR